MDLFFHSIKSNATYTNPLQYEIGEDSCKSFYNLTFWRKHFQGVQGMFMNHERITSSAQFSVNSTFTE